MRTLAVLRRGLLLAAVAWTAAFGLAAPSLAADMPPVTASDRVLGRADAPVTVVEYASFVCSHCGDWHRDVYPQFKARYIDTGRVRYVFRDLPTQPAELSTAAALVGRCAAPGRFFAVADAFFDGQAALFAGGKTWFSDAVAQTGRSQTEIRECFARPETEAGLNADIAAGSAAGVRGTPTFFVDGKIVADHSLEALGAAIEAATPTRRRGR